MVLPNIGEWELPPDTTSLSGFGLKYPLSDGWKPIGIGGLIGFVAAIFLIPIILLYGYRYRLGRAGARGDSSAPEFNDIGRIIWNGLLLIAAFLPYVLLATAIGVGLIALEGVVSEGVVAGLIVAWSVVASYLGIAIHPTFVATGSIRETYSGLLFLKVALTRTYLIGFLLNIVLRIIVGIVMLVVALISIITIVGPIIVFSVWYAYDEYIAGAIWGKVARELASEGQLPAVTGMDELDL